MEHFALMMYLMIFLLKQKIASINMSKKEWSPGLAGGVSDPRNETVMKMFSLIDLWTYVQRVYGRTSLGAMDVRP